MPDNSRGGCSQSTTTPQPPGAGSWNFGTGAQPRGGCGGGTSGQTGLPGWMQNADTASQATHAAGTDPAWEQFRNNAVKTGSGDFLGGTQGFNDIFSNFQNRAGNRSGVTNNTLNGQYLNATPNGLQSRDWRGNAETQKTLTGGYLNAAPQLRENVDPMLAGIRNRANAEAGDANNAIRSQFARNGMGFSTVNQQAQQAAGAAASARSNENEAATRLQAQQAADQAKLGTYLTERGFQTQAAGSEDAANRARLSQLAQNYGQERGFQQQSALTSDAQNQAAAQFEAGTRAQNYGQERGYQQNAGNQLASIYGNQLNYLQGVNDPQAKGLAQAAQLIQGLSGGGPIATPNSTVVRQPGVYDYALNTLGAVAGAGGGGV